MREVLPGVYEWSWFSAEKQVTADGVKSRLMGSGLWN